ncbi:hypothetical protein PROP_03547 [Propionicimonas sp. T2.31MG-18]
MNRWCAAPGERRTVIGMAAFIVVLHLAGWGVLAGLVASGHVQAGPGQVFGLGLGLTAYTLGMRHPPPVLRPPARLAPSGPRRSPARSCPRAQRPLPEFR